MTHSIRTLARGLAIAIAVALSFDAPAAPILHGDFDGATVTFNAVTEEALTPGDGPILFGTPSVVGDELDFNPTSFAASATGAGGVDVTDGLLQFEVKARPGYVIDEITFSERGDYTLVGGGGAGTFASVQAAVFGEILEVSGIELAAAIRFQGNLTFTPSDGDFDLATDGVAVARIFHGSIAFDLQAVLDAAGVTGEVTRVGFALDNTLVATSEFGTSAFIAKKDHGGAAVGVAVVTDVPEPQPGELLALAALLLFVTSGRMRFRGTLAVLAGVATLSGGSAMAAPFTFESGTITGTYDFATGRTRGALEFDPNDGSPVDYSDYSLSFDFDGLVALVGGTSANGTWSGDAETSAGRNARLRITIDDGDPGAWTASPGPGRTELGLGTHVVLDAPIAFLPNEERDVPLLPEHYTELRVLAEFDLVDWVWDASEFAGNVTGYAFSGTFELQAVPESSLVILLGGAAIALGVVRSGLRRPCLS